MSLQQVPVSQDSRPGNTQTPAWSELVEKICSREPSGMEDLYRAFYKSIRFHVFRSLGPQDLEDRVHDIFLAITESIQKGDLREPRFLTAYIRTIVRRQIACLLDNVIHTRRTYTDLETIGPVSDRNPTPERNAIEQENFKFAMRILKALPARDRNILIRFYLMEQEPDQICREMNLTETQFRLVKSRAKARFGELGKARLARRRAS
jgi:RNA polymerase sigma-70 factor (ECF subfamily)